MIQYIQKTGLPYPKNKILHHLHVQLLQVSSDDTLRAQLSRESYKWASSFNWQESATEFMTIINHEIERTSGQLAIDQLAAARAAFNNIYLINQ